MVEESEDPFISTAEISLSGFAEAGIPGRFWVDYLPILKHVPSWVPGAGFQKKAEYWRRITGEMRERPFQYVKDQLVSLAIIQFYCFGVGLNFISKARGTAPPSVAAILIEKLPAESSPMRAEEERIAKDVAAIAYAGVFF